MSPDQPLILFVVNPKSGTGNFETFMEDLEQTLQNLKTNFHILQTASEGNEALLQTTLAKLSPKKIVAVGGDGTVRLVAKTVLNKNIPIAIIPRGSANGMAKELNIPQDWKDALNIALEGDPKPCDVVYINDDQISLHIGDVGFHAKMIKRFELGGTRGLWGYGKHLLKELFNMGAHTFIIKLPQKTIKKKAYAVLFANSRQYGTGAVINPDGKLDDGKFELIVILPYKKIVLITLILRLLMGKINLKQYIENYPVSEAEIISRRPLFVQTDGESLGKIKKLKLKAGKKALILMVPKETKV